MTGRIPSQTNSSLPPVRRQFHSSSRRPPMNSNNTSTSNTTQSTVHTDASASSEDIIIRDETGNFRLDVPNMAPLPRDEAKDEKEVENRLIESYRKHQQHIDSNELRTSLQASLQSKLASLDEDKWMFGEDDDVPF
ncbi:hypothetical protein EJ08DRAFT_653277 [Tothia fuscella]|uniref:Uncharacterized protein n=1 Tax=Tothia fuscella TaxID=1048955 RepID=A0A9P4NHN0_9PEZI|nr:hypothetical protein EJ08DRAFT_653277 [Tothia fuscella]